MPSDATAILMQLGDYRFSLARAAYDELQRTTEYRWQAQPRLGRAPAYQYVGPGPETLRLRGTVYPAFRAGPAPLDALRAEAGQGRPLLLTDGTGRVWGRWAVTRLEETRTVFFADGTPRRIDFRLDLANYGPDHAETARLGDR